MQRRVRKKAHNQAPSQLLSNLILDPRSSAKSAGTNFLNCTKNTELTGTAFALTVSFALNKERQLVPAAKAA